jgi:hypothetical protein
MITVYKTLAFNVQRTIVRIKPIRIR